MSGGSHGLLEQFIDDSLLFFGTVAWERDLKKLQDGFPASRINFAVLHCDIGVGLHQGRHEISVLPGREAVN